MDIDATETAHVACSDFHASQQVDELARAIELVAKLDPRIIVEIGCDAGGTLYCWTQMATRVYGITLPHNTFETGGGGKKLETHGADVLLGDSHSFSSSQWLDRRLDGRKIDVLIIDGDHSYKGVWMDLAMYGPLVRRGGIVLMHDIAVTTDSRATVWKVWQEIRTLSDVFDTEEIVNVSHGALGWGVIRVRGGEPWD